MQCWHRAKSEIKLVFQLENRLKVKEILINSVKLGKTR